MNRRTSLMLARALLFSVAVISTGAIAQPAQNGTAEDAKAMLVKAGAAVTADKTKALDMFNKGQGGFLDRDLYVFCFNMGDGKVVATGNANSKGFIGQDVRTVKDANGRAYGQEFYTAAQKPEGQMTEVSYVAPRLGTNTTPVPKAGFITRAGDLGCGVGYYK
jgi:hypothetical protein